MKIIILDENAFLCESIRNFLPDYLAAGVKAFVHPNAGIEVLSQESFDLLISEIKFKGYEPMAYLRLLNSLNRPVPLFVISALRIPPEAAALKNLDLVGYLEKPFELSDLQNFLEQFYHNKHKHINHHLNRRSL